MMHKPAPIIACVIMAVTLSSCSSLKSLHAPSALSSMTWKYQETPDKKVRLGRRGNSVSIQTEGVCVRFDAPKDWKVVSCVDQTLVWHFAASAPDATLAFGVKVVRFPDNPPLESRYNNYLEGIHKVYDPAVEMVPGQPFTVQGKKIPSYQYSSPGWGQRLVVMIPDGSVTTVFEFYTRTAAVYAAPVGHNFIQKILSTYSLRKA